MFVVMDIHNAYCAFEAVFRPSLRGTPFVVLSNNMGNVVSRSEAARALGVRMGEPWFHLSDMQRHHGLIGLASNFPLYSCLSTRMHSIVSGLSPDTIVYSIDEAIACLDGIPGDHTERVWRMKERVKQWLGIDMGGGIGKTKTLCKLASTVAKSAFRKPGAYPAEFAQVCNLGTCSPEVLRDIMDRTLVTEVWGIGRKIGAQLLEADIRTALQFSQLDPAFVRKRWGLQLEKTLRELNGISCIEIDGLASRQQIAVTRSLPQPIASREELERLIALFTSTAATKMRLQGKVCAQLSVFVMTSPFRKGERYAKSCVVPVGHPTSDTRALTIAATRAARRIWASGYELMRCGVMLLDLSDRDIALNQSVLELEDTSERDTRSHDLMLAVDKLNERYGRKTLRVAMEHKGLSEKAEFLTPNYMTRWSDVPLVHA